AMAHFDWYVNSGTHATSALNEAVGPGKPGDTLTDRLHAALKDPGSEDALLDKYMKVREHYYNQRPLQKNSQYKYVQGWINRANDIRTALAIPGTAVLESQTAAGLAAW